MSESTKVVNQNENCLFKVFQNISQSASKQDREKEEEGKKKLN